MAGSNPDRGTCTVDATSKPTGMMITGTEGPNIGKSILAILELDVDKLNFCYDLSGIKRLTDFKTAPGTRFLSAE